MMESKFEFEELPIDLKYKITREFTTKDILNFVHTLRSKEAYYGFFKPEILDVRKLLHYIVRGDHNVVQQILKENIYLMLKRGKVTDCSGREFENVSSFEYTLWALDKHMWTMMIACIPQNEDSRELFAQLMAQYNKVNTKGVTYRLNGKTITEQHFDFENTIIKELQTQVDSIDAPGDKNWDAINKQWREGVGGAQKLLPMPVVDEYCSSEPFYPVPQFTSQPKSSKQFYNWTAKTPKDENWFSVDSKLSVDFAIYKGPVRWRGGIGGEVGSVVRRDLDAMTALCKVRTNDFINLKSQLEEQAGLDNRHQVVPM